MSDLRRLCHALLKGPALPAAVAEAEALLDAAWAGAGEDEARYPFGEPWNPGGWPGPDDGATRRRVLHALAPVALLEGVWLARVAQPATAHRASECHLFDLYCRLVGLDDPARSPPLRFGAKLVEAGIHLPPLDSPAFFAAVPEAGLDFAAAHLGLMHRPRRFFPELLGYTLAHVQREPAWWDAESTGQRGPDRALALAALAAYPQREAQAGRIRRGWCRYRRLFDELARAVVADLARRPTAAEAMADLLRTKCRHAIGYHGRIALRGRSLDAWLAESADDPGPLLAALRDSPWVDRACPEASRLIRAVDFGGPMFGVFSAEERRACLEWIADPTVPVLPSSLLPGPERVGATLPAPSPPRKIDPRDLFTRLLATESPADCPPEADALILGILRRARGCAPLQRGHRRGFPYTPDGFHARIEAIHRHEVGRYRPLSGPPRPGREDCEWAALQLAPAILVDGAWLAGVGSAAGCLGETGRHLLKTYADELGAGRTEWNHPNVYRRLLDSLGFELPPFAGEAFARSPLFLDAAFDIPAYLLAMGLRTERYFPELLGLNLAIELSGLGAGYLRGVDILRHHGIDPAILQLHLSIDNLGTGHAARAREAVILFLDEVRRREGAEAVQAQWRRVWTGYLSLHAAALGLVLGFLGRYLRHGWIGRLWAVAFRGRRP